MFEYKSMIDSLNYLVSLIFIAVIVLLFVSGTPFYILVVLLTLYFVQVQMKQSQKAEKAILLTYLESLFDKEIIKSKEHSFTKEYASIAKLFESACNTISVTNNTNQFNKSIIDSITNGLILLDQDKNIISVNHAVGHLLHLESSFMLGQELSKFVDLSPFVNDKEIAETTVKSKDKEIDVLVSLSKFKRSGDRNLGYICSLQDIRETKKVQSELVSLTKIVAQSTIAIVMIDLHGLITYANPQMCKLSAYDEIELIGQDFSILLSSKYSTDFYEELRISLLENSIWKGEVCNITKLGAEYTTSYKVTPMIDKNGEVEAYVIVSEDITYQRTLIEELKLSKEKAESASKAKGIFLANMSHEIRTPLNAIIGFSELLQKSENLDRSEKSYIRTIIESGEHLLDVINDILEVSTIESGVMKYNQKEFDLVYLVKTVIQMFDLKAINKGIKLYLQIDSIEPNWIEMDEQKLRQILINMLENAIKFTEHGFVKLRVYMHNQFLYFDIEDTGIGIENDKIKNLFLPFEKEHADTQGTGLGLAISHGLASFMRGELTVVSTLGKGTSVTLKLPFNIAKKNERSLGTTSLKWTTKEGSKLLIVDDEEGVRWILNEYYQDVCQEVRLA
ncbi:ATP-binding protein [bacterium]|nr:ATP-binding protein [bacterium]